jgi:hypothetical protein
MINDAVKDIALGRLIDWEDSLADSLLRLVLVSKFQYYAWRREGALGLADAVLIPPWDVLKNLQRDLRAKNTDPKKLNLYKNIPFFGKLYHWRFGRAHDWTMDDIYEREREVNKGRFFKDWERVDPWYVNRSD